MEGKKRQETTSSSSLSGRRDLVSPAPVAGNQTQQHAKAVSVGCMSGIFHLLSKYHTRSKFLTFGKKQEVKAPSPAKPTTTTITATIITSPPHNDKYSSETTGRTSLEKPRSPVIPAEIRSSGSANSPRVVARLMGIADIPASPTESVVVAEKRRKLLGALEKCDEDLKALKRIIDAVRASQTPPRAAEKVAGGGGGNREKGAEEEEDGEEEEEEREDEPSPVSVLDFHQRSPTSTAHSKRTRYAGQALQQHHIQKQQKQKPIRKIKTGDDEHNSGFCFLNKSTPPSSVINITTLTSVLHPTKARPPLIETARKLTTTTILPWSKAVVESVDEVCRDVDWGQTREVGVIGLLIQDFIFKDLVEEITKEMLLMMKKNKTSSCFDYVFGSSRIVGLPHEACKRKFCF